MSKPFTDDLPLDGYVKVAGSDRLHVYHGYLGTDPNRCAVSIHGEADSTQWVERRHVTRAVLTPKAPWEVVSCTGKDGSKGLWVLSADYEIIWEGTDTPEGHALAHLIAAAPDLLKGAQQATRPATVARIKAHQKAAAQAAVTKAMLK